MQHVFTNIYERCFWGNNGSKLYNGSSGDGSDVEFNLHTYIPFLKKFITDNKIQTICDLGCGDFRCGPLIYNDIDCKYIGYDTYSKVIEANKLTIVDSKFNFIHLDFFSKKEEIIAGDMCILKDVIQHWQLEKIYIFLDYLVSNKKFKYILICNCSNQTQDNTTISDGEMRPLHSNFFPLKKYNPVEVYTYGIKQVCLITTC